MVPRPERLCRLCSAGGAPFLGQRPGEACVEYVRHCVALERPAYGRILYIPPRYSDVFGDALAGSWTHACYGFQSVSDISYPFAPRYSHWMWHLCRGQRSWLRRGRGFDCDRQDRPAVRHMPCLLPAMPKLIDQCISCHQAGAATLSTRGHYICLRRRMSSC
jgi:hypothetical protein